LYASEDMSKSKNAAATGAASSTTAVVTDNDDKKSSPALFANHTARDSALQQRNQQQSPNNQMNCNDNNHDDDGCRTSSGQAGLTWIAKLAIFILFPFIVGLFGLYVSYLETFKTDKNHKLSFDQDFIFPFLLALALAIVVGFRTSNFRLKQLQPIVAWPKVQRVKKYVYKSQLAESSSTGKIKTSTGASNTKIETLTATSAKRKDD
jgi:hypothetical protein